MAGTLNRYQLAEISNQLGAVRQQIDRDATGLQQIYPQVSPERDLRITQFNMVSNVLVGTMTSLLLTAAYLLDDNWWNSGLVVTPVSGRDRDMIVSEIMVQAGQGFLNGIFHTVEAVFRVFLRTLAPGAANNGTAEFKSIYESLFKTHLDKCPANGSELLDLLRLTRNTIHNNGLYFHQALVDTTITYKGNSYTFQHSKPVTFILWEHVAELADDVRVLMLEVAKDKKLLAIQTELTDPFQ